MATIIIIISIFFRHTRKTSFCRPDKVGKVARIGGWWGGGWVIRAMPELRCVFCFDVFPNLHTAHVAIQALSCSQKHKKQEATLTNGRLADQAPAKVEHSTETPKLQTKEYYSDLKGSWGECLSLHMHVGAHPRTLDVLKLFFIEFLRDFYY